MQVELVQGDAVHWLNNEFDIGEVDAIITDPPYDRVVVPVSAFKRVCSGNVVAFCKPELVWSQADEYLFWVKTPSTKNFRNKCGRFVEIIAVYRRGSTFNQLHWSQMIGVYDDRHVEATVHPYQKPLTLIERLVRIYTNPGDTVLDPFMGSGTTGIVCQHLGRNFIGIEQDKEYFKLAKRRINGCN